MPRLKQSIADAQASLAQRTADATARTEEDAKKQADLEKQRLADQQKAQLLAAQQLAEQQAATAKAAADKAAADKAAADKAAADKAAADRAAAQRAAAQNPPAQAAATSNELRPISTPAPSYPRDAYRDGTSGEVQVEFTVGTDGSVTSARVVRADPPRVFDREALSAVKRWKFQPVGSPVTSRRTIGFKPGN